MARLDLRISQVELGKRWGRSPNYLYMLEAGKKRFPRKMLDKLELLERDAAAAVRAREEIRESSRKPAATVSEAIARAERAEKKLATLRAGLTSLLDLSGPDAGSDLDSIVAPIVKKEVESLPPQAGEQPREGDWPSAKDDARVRDAQQHPEEPSSD